MDNYWNYGGTSECPLLTAEANPSLENPSDILDQPIYLLLSLRNSLDKKATIKGEPKQK